MDKSDVFDINAIAYHRFRPLYPEALISDIKSYAKLKADDNILEIGFGTGQATRSFIDKGYNIYAIEKGKKLYEVAKQQFHDASKLTLINEDYFDHQFPNDYFDLVFSATAFHWLDTNLSFPLVYKQLRKGGTIALFWNHAFVGDKNDPVHQATQKVYQQFGYGKELVPFTEKDLNKVIDQLAINDYKNIEAKLYHATRKMNGEDYLELLSTYSDHSFLLEQEEFKKAIIKAIADNGNAITIYDTIDLYLANK